ncbi:MAG: hypothetical protein MPI95_03875 [Nitrosopumilus sp.]|nr:hypothetical protein [Nitrosopumilus sp.]CAI9830867.1 exported hypothetical protein [Nitrosopumilaceae archaeon]MDA7941122.1 hypothetical protein [Nitrosopumilus sp.]MDA7942480.1 hypothetical protein [Nitrosopumilus sp.]MDA7944561.1 hypothetical protein [Nitrosopumilus sp.]
MKVLMAAVFAAAVLGTGAAYAGQAYAEPDGAEPYQLADAFHALEVMDRFAALDDSYYLVVDEDKAAADPEVTDLDLEIALVYAAHNDALVEAILAGDNPDTFDEGPVREAISDLTSGKLRLVFTEGLEELLEGPFSDAAGLLVFVYYMSQDMQG